MKLTIWQSLRVCEFSSVRDFMKIVNYGFGILILFGLLLSSKVEAAFFMRLKSSAIQAVKAAGGVVVNKCDAVVNGQEAKLTVVGFDRPLAEASAEISRFLNVSETGAGKSFDVDGSWIRLKENGIAQNVILFPGNSADTCSAWLIETEADKEVGVIPELPDNNPFPSAELKSCIQLKRSGTVLTVHESVASPSECLRSVEATMASLGWETVISGTSTAYFAKNGHAAAVTVHNADGISRVSVIRAGER